VLSEFVLIMYDGMDGRSGVILANAAAPTASGPIVTPVRRKAPTVPQLPAPKETDP